MRNKTRRLTESAMLMAIAIVLEVISKQFIPGLPVGGQITIVSMLPIVLISYRYGMKWGFFTGFVYSLLEMVMGMDNVSAAFQPGYFGDGAMLVNAMVMCFLDYTLAFTVLGLGGAFRNRVKNPSLALSLGAAVALTGRFLSHVASGFVLFGSYAEWYFTQEAFPAWGAQVVAALDPAGLALVYSLVYNAAYMVPEILLTAAAAYGIGKIPKLAEKIQ